MDTCTVTTCDLPVAARGLCWKHYMRKRRHGDATVTVRTYREPHKCRHCGTTTRSAFYSYYKSICKVCRKLKLMKKQQMK